MTSPLESVASRRHRGLQVVLVDRAELVTEWDAAQMMGRRKLAIAHDVSRGYLTPAAAFDLSGRNLIEGVTRASVEEQVEWRESASLAKKARRFVGLLVYYV